MNNFGADVETVGCPSCRAAMVRGMRFCRQCGYRLGEGVEEYAETRRFTGAPAAAAPTAPHAARETGFGTFGDMPQNWGAMTPSTMSTAPLAQFETGWQQSLTKSLKCTSRRMHWSVWMILALAIMMASGNAVFKPFRDGARGISSASTPRAHVGIVFEDADDDTGAFIKSIRGVDSPADRAGLIGGDTITSFDGQQVEGERDLLRLIRATPIGKAVEVQYIRDGEAKLTTLTTASSDDTDAFAPPSGSEGFLGINPGGAKRVAIPDSKIYGVQLNNVLRNRPADIAGIRNGDIVIEFNGAPIRTAPDLIRRINQASPGGLVKVVIMRGTERLEIPVKMGRD